MEIGSELYMYHEKQDAALCGVHCVNSLLQGHYFTEIDLMTIARELDEMERQAMLEMGADTNAYLKFMAEDSGNVADDGNYSIQVLAKALSIWGLNVVPLLSPEAVESKQNPLIEKAFICNLASHWLTIRKFGDDWYNLNSLLENPQYLSNFYLSAFLDTLIAKGYTIFCVRGDLPRVLPDPSNLSDPVWKKAPKKPANSSSSTSTIDYEQQLEDALAQSELEAAIQASLMNNSTDSPITNKRKTEEPPVEIIDDEDEELQAAIRLSQQMDTDPKVTSTTTSTSTVANEVPSASKEVPSADVGAEPEKSEATTELSIRLPDSTNVRRRFFKESSIEVVYKFLESKGFNKEKYVLVSNFPRKVYEFSKKSLEEEGLSLGAALMLQLKQ